MINASETCFLDAEYNWLATHKVTVAVSPRLNHLLGSTTPLEQTKLAFTPFTAVPAGYHCQLLALYCQLLALYCQLLAHHCPLMVQECTQRAHRWPAKSVPLWSSLGVTGEGCRPCRPTEPRVVDRHGHRGWPIGMRTMSKRAVLFYDYPAKDGNVYGQGRRERLEQMLTRVRFSLMHFLWVLGP